ncbi:MAG: DUF1698 domain-containing protein [Candidatus Jorgensenbacteria bacterium]|nr:DUF1698 domain-containing protein [Candidatus Jorgensenbacteria bacterium]
MKLTAQAKRRLISKVPYWWHTIDLGDGVTTPGWTHPRVHRLLASAIPKNLKQKTVLDVGAWDGYYTFEAERRGARVTAIDNNQHRKGHRGFDVAKRILGSRAKFLPMDLYDLPRLKGRFDVVLLFGVIYHVKNPLLALEIVAAKTKNLLILESHYIKTKEKEPMMRFYPGRELGNDPTNWWGPNIQCLKDMLRTVGFKRVSVFRTYLNTSDKGRVIMKAYR